MKQKPPIQNGNTATARTGVVIMLSAGALIAATSLLAKTLSLPLADTPGLHPFQISAGRFLFALFALLLFIAVFRNRRPTLQGANWRWHIARSLCGWLGVTAMFAAVARMPVAEATALSFLSPVVTMGLAIVLLGEYLTLRKVIAASLALAGAVLILRPGVEAFQPAGLLALVAAGCMGLEAIYIKRLSDSESALRILLINNMVGALISVVVASTVWLWPVPNQWALLVALGMVMVAGQALFIQAMKRGEASFVMPAFYSVLVFAALYDLIFCRIFLTSTALLGAALIVGSAIVLTQRVR